MIIGFAGSIARQETARFAMKSSTGCQVAPPLSVLHTPPPTLPAHIVFGLVGWMTIERVRPPMFPGPSETQPAWPGGSPAVGGGAIRARGSTERPVGMPATLALTARLARTVRSSRT